ncbi:hypothetical protein N7539_006051 [Penicillium diatomitis]|uniref:GP-PDE domain-containing protein n=1 Tax=Penicillium diatomitis TaxID=2819901 RepID=A0A9X0BTU4_9EURO|nr:uncharacterized protein N7539_006051 [Penicillium diatomitis]KAJ5483851.1 hypothetical protein N7539_006051 [Penicillium diatomitis]
MNGSQTTLAVPRSEADLPASSLSTEELVGSSSSPSKLKGSVSLPQTISHRGYKGKFPENTLAAVKGATEAGTDALEIDLHLSRDAQIVLSHVIVILVYSVKDPTLQRCYGVKKKIGDCDWAYLKTLRTVQVPHEPMPRLAEILEYINQPEKEHIWVLLDIKVSSGTAASAASSPRSKYTRRRPTNSRFHKVTNDPDMIMRRIAEIISSIPASSSSGSSRPWHERIVLGFWSGDYIPLRNKYLPNFPMALICFDFKYARKFLHVEDLAYNVNQSVLMGPLGWGFLDDVRAAQRQIYLWTVNAPNLMRWGIRHGVDGVITDDPALFRKVCEAWEREHGGRDGADTAVELRTDRLSMGQRVKIVLTAVLVVMFGWMIKRRISKRMKSVHRTGGQKGA